MRVILFQIFIVFILFGCFFLPVEMIGCFVCSSINNSTNACVDTFNVTRPEFYVKNCKAARKGRNGLFPATDCIKLKAKGWNKALQQEEMIYVRTCVVDNGDINSDTEIGRSNHCGLVNYLKLDRGITIKDENGQERSVTGHYDGCLLSCRTDGCNSAPSLHNAIYSVISFAMAILAFLGRRR